jgi:hypothetical protein
MVLKVDVTACTLKVNLMRFLYIGLSQKISPLAKAEFQLAGGPAMKYLAECPNHPIRSFFVVLLGKPIVSSDLGFLALLFQYCAVDSG